MPALGFGVGARGQGDVAQGRARLGDELGLLDRFEHAEPLEEHRARLLQVALEAQGLAQGAQGGADPEAIAQRLADLEGLAVLALGFEGLAAPR
ncbi:hypothetical protein D3C86_1603480 [compost metagenome]